jgi:hypothetical protein
MAKAWGILSPWEYQVRAIAQLVFYPKTCLFLIRKTGEGKSAVVLTLAMLLHGICLVVAPLLGLGCDQVVKAQRPAYKVESPIIWTRTGVKICWPSNGVFYQLQTVTTISSFSLLHPSH